MSSKIPTSTRKSSIQVKPTFLDDWGLSPRTGVKRKASEMFNDRDNVVNKRSKSPPELKASNLVNQQNPDQHHQKRQIN